MRRDPVLDLTEHRRDANRHYEDTLNFLDVVLEYLGALHALETAELAVRFGHVVTFRLASTREADVASSQRHFKSFASVAPSHEIEDTTEQVVAAIDFWG
ncbi:hypothetical protein HBI81_243560 [Parastagonospora nodorum]|nr:hypothetical protein HBI81_243560 [Parastagonospora nodorum]